MNLPIHLHHQAVLDALIHFVPEVYLGLLLCAPQQQHPLQIGQVLNAGQLGNAGALHHAEQSYEQSRVFAQDLVGLRGYLQKPSVQSAVLAAQNVHEVRCENEGHRLPVHAQLLLPVAQEMTEVDVEQIASLGHHYVIVVSVAYSQDVRGHAVAGAGVHEFLAGFFQIVLAVVLLLQPVQQHLLIEGAQCHLRLLLDVADSVGLLHHLYDALLEPGGQTAVGDHVQVQSVLQPEVVHYLQHLQRQHVLSQVVSVLNDQLYLGDRVLLVLVLELQPDRLLL